VQVALKIWRYDSSSGERALREYEIDAPEEATLLDCLDIVKDRHDGSLAYRKSCRMMICGSCGMRMDGAAVLACKTRMYDIAQEGRVPVVSAMGNLPIVKDLVVDMDPFWEKFKAIKPYLQPGYDQPEDGREYHIDQPRMNVIHKEALCINCGCCVSECNSMESDPDFLGPQALAKGMRFVGDPRDAASARAASSATSAARRASTRVTRSRSSAPRRLRTASIATWARSTRSGSSDPPRRPAGFARQSSSRRRRASSRR
jgi:succinate dehydrogenase / fumarate reductase iron-sulfur subunit